MATITLSMPILLARRPDCQVGYALTTPLLAWRFLSSEATLTTGAEWHCARSPAHPTPLGEPGAGVERRQVRLVASGSPWGAGLLLRRHVLNASQIANPQRHRTLCVGGSRRTNPMATPGETIRRLRKARGMSQAAVAETVMSTTYFSKIENDRKGLPTIETLAKVDLAFERARRPLTDVDRLDLFVAALTAARAKLNAKVADVRYGSG